MWQSLISGDKVLAGDTIRYRSGSPDLTSSQDKIYDVVKTDFHYFEMVARQKKEGSDELDRRTIKYMDVGYHISLEIWTGKLPYPTLPKKEATGNKK
jgi:hypothetical protein